jgi:hypothetical protein
MQLWAPRDFIDIIQTCARPLQYAEIGQFGLVAVRSRICTFHPLHCNFGRKILNFESQKWDRGHQQSNTVTLNEIRFNL